MIQFIVFITFLLLLFNNCEGACRDDNNEEVDWYYGLKLYKSKENANNLIKEGTGYFVITSNQQKREWTLSQKQINSSNNMLANTMACIYNGKCDFFITYNDEEFNKSVSNTKAHAKGVMACTGDNCFHLIHSVPKLGTSEAYKYPTGGLSKGQSVMCTSHTRQQLDNICQCYFTVNMNVYSSKIQEPSLMSYCTKIAAGKYLKMPPYSSDTTVLSKNGITIRYLCKGKKYNDSMYDKDAVEALQCNLLTQTWLNTASKQPSNCSGEFKVYNIAAMHVGKPETSWSTSNDHSKWAICEDTEWVCVGDMNRDRSQDRRGGGLACMKDINLWKSYKNTIIDLEPCPKIDYSVILV